MTLSKLVLSLALAFAACGPSNAQVRTAKTTTYAAHGPIFQVALETAKQTYQLDQVDAAGHRFTTAPQFYSPEGGRQSPGAGGFVNMSDRTVMLSLRVEVVDAEPRGAVVVVTPVTFQVIAGSPQPRELTADDPNLPGWVHGRVDALAVAIYENGKELAVSPP